MSRKDLYDVLAEVERLFSGPRIIGLEPLFHDLSSFVTREQTYPPHNIIKDGEDRRYLEIAAAGFDASDITVEVDDDHLTVRGSSNLVEKANREYVHQGVARRDWELSFRLGQHMVVEQPIMQNGMVVIPLQRVVPEEKQPRTIPVLDVNRELDEAVEPLPTREELKA